MTAVAPSSTTVTGLRRPQLSPLETILQNERRDFISILGRIVRRTCRVPLQDVGDIVNTAMMVAISREREGKGWDPAGDLTIDQYLYYRVLDAVKESRRSARRKPATPTGDASEIASTAKGGLGGLVASVAESEAEVAEFRKLAADLRRHFEEETGGRIPLGIMDQHLLGIDEHAKIAKKLKCTVPQVKAGWERLKYHGKRMAAAARKTKKERS